MDKNAKIFTIICLVTISFIVIYLFEIYFPDQEQERLLQLKLESNRKEHAESDARLQNLYHEAKQEQAERAAEQEKRIQNEKFEKFINDEKTRADHSAQQETYKQCIYSIQQTYNYQWARACANVARAKSIKLQECLSEGDLSKLACQELYGDIDYSSYCQLPENWGRPINESLKEGQDRCLTSAQTGF